MKRVPPPLPINEPARLKRLNAYHLLDTPPEPIFDRIASLASYLFDAPIALVTLVDAERQWFKARIGLPAPEMPREHAICAYTILDPDGLVIPDTLEDRRFRHYPPVEQAPWVRFYAGMPLVTTEGYALGTLCVLDTRPRDDFGEQQRHILDTLAQEVMAYIDLRRSSLFLAEALQDRRKLNLEQRLQEAEVARSSKEKDRFLAMLAHELRNPLSPILNAVELLRTPHPGDALEVIERQVRHMARLLEDLLDISRVATGKVTLYRSAVDLTQVVRHCVRIARERFVTREQPFEFSSPPEPLWIDADPVRIEQIVGNLLHNAAKYTGRGKPVNLLLYREDGEAVITVRDAGIGISPEWQQRIFEPFVQSEESQAMTRSGLGLGLSLVRQMTHLHGGSVTVRSAGAGLGSEFTVRLPLIAAPAPMGAPTAGPQEGGRLLSILIVEDNADFSGTLVRLLRHWGHQVESVASGALALAKAQELDPDLVLIDLGLPDLDGCTVARQLSASLPRLPRLIAMTGYSQEADQRRAEAAGFLYYLLKPIDPAVLKKCLGELRGEEEEVRRGEKVVKL